MQRARAGAQRAARKGVCTPKICSRLRTGLNGAIPCKSVPRISKKKTIIIISAVPKRRPVPPASSASPKVAPLAPASPRCPYLRAGGLCRQPLLCRCRAARPWARPCASSPAPGEVPASGFICTVRRLQDQHTYHERHILAARRWENASKCYIFKAFSHPAGAPSSSAASAWRHLWGKGWRGPSGTRGDAAGTRTGTGRGERGIHGEPPLNTTLRADFPLATPIFLPLVVSSVEDTILSPTWGIFAPPASLGTPCRAGASRCAPGWGRSEQPRLAGSWIDK